jgi:opacity protein-like surface antigen
MYYINGFNNLGSLIKGQKKSFKIFIMCLFFAVPHFIVAQNLPIKIGLGLSLGLEYSENTTNTTNTNMVIDSIYYYHNKNKYYDVPIDTYLVVDLKYFEASIGFWWGGRTIISEREGTWTLGTPGNTEKSKNGGLVGGWLWSIFLKIPDIGRMMWFPMVGIESRMMTWIRPGDDANTDLVVDNHQTWNNFWYKFGIGFDVEITDKIYACNEYLLGFRSKNNYEKELQKTNGSVDGIPVSISAKIKFYYKVK